MTASVEAGEAAPAHRTTPEAAYAEINRAAKALITSEGQPKAVGILSIVFGILFGAVIAAGSGSLFPGMLMGGLACLTALYLGRGLVLASFRKRAASNFVKERALEHRIALGRNLSRALRRNDYGAVAVDRRLDVAREFATSVCLPRSILRYTEVLEVIEATLAEADALDSSRAEGHGLPSI